MRSRKSLVNIIFSLSGQFVAILAGFIVPRVIILRYGSPVNGLVLSLQQVMAYLMTVESGLMGATIYALYKPLSEGDMYKAGLILSCSNRSFRRAGSIFAALLLVCAFAYPLFVKTPIPYFESFLLILVIGANGATQFFGTGKYKALLAADQRLGVVDAVNAGVTVLYSGTVILLSGLKIPVHLVYAAAALGYGFRLAILDAYCKRKYPEIDYCLASAQGNVPYQKDVFFQQVMGLLVFNIASVIATFLLGLTAVSIYSIYNLAATAILILTGSIINGAAAGLGDLLARNRKQAVYEAYREFIYGFMLALSFAASMLIVLLKPFMRVYSKGIADAAYIDDTLILLFILVIIAAALRNQGAMVLSAAGKYPSMRKGSVLEVILAVGVSLAGGIFFGLAGIVAGRIVAMLYRFMDFTERTKEVTGVPKRFVYCRVLLMAAGAFAAAWANMALLTVNTSSLPSFLASSFKAALLNLPIVTLIFLLMDHKTGQKLCNRLLAAFNPRR